VKILEWLIKPDVVAALPKHKDQHAYTPMHSTTRALLPIATQIAIGFIDKKTPCYTAVATIEVRKAFDLLNHTLFIEEICESILLSNYICWISAYLPVKSGFPQGSDLSPDLWNSFVSDHPDEAEVQSSYADDIHLVESDADLDTLSEKLDCSVKATSVWSKRKNFVTSDSVHA
jgi:hypothetical protein